MKGKTNAMMMGTDTSDATALASDIALNKIAYGSEGIPLTGTLEHLDTSDATATESDILLGKTAYAGGVELTGTLTTADLTGDATAVETDILNPKTAYTADGKKTGQGYLVEHSGGVFYTPNYIYPYSGSMPSSTFRGASNLLTLNTGNSTGGNLYMFHTCTSMTSVACPKMLTYSTAPFYQCTALQTAILGSIGYPVTAINANAFTLCTQLGLTITVYVTPGTQPLAGSPWGATNATIVYRSAVRGSVL